MKKEEKINKKMSFIEIMHRYPEAMEILTKKGMHCVGCPMAMQETLEQGCLTHGLNPNKLVKEINELLKTKSKRAKRN